MFDWILANTALAILFSMAAATWLASLVKRDASIIDSVWPLFFLAATLVYGTIEMPNGPRWVPTLALIGTWAARLCLYLTWRNWGQPEDRRYRAIRERNQPHYALKSLVIVFTLQAVLAWVITWPVLPTVKAISPWSWLDTLGVGVFLVGLMVETAADIQMARFKADPAQHGRVMDQGLWRYSRHPNYFGEFVVWWGFYLLALGAGTPLWTVVSPLLITLLLLKVSGVPLLEQDIAERRPAYGDYIARTSAFFPWPPAPRGGQTP
jgi:steroid 5-alpha reductase family enzyme